MAGAPGSVIRSPVQSAQLYRGLIEGGDASDGYILTDCTLTIFQKRRSKRLIGSQNGQPYQINKAGLRAVRSQLDNQ